MYNHSSIQIACPIINVINMLSSLSSITCCSYASHCPCDFGTPRWFFGYLETAPAMGSRTGNCNGDRPHCHFRSYATPAHG